MSINYETQTYSGIHMICDIKKIKNKELLNNVSQLKELLDNICTLHNYIILKKIDHIFEPQGCTIIYMLSESHISIHTFPEKGYIAFDLYTCRHYENDNIYMEIYDYLITQLNAKKEEPIIIKRSF
jgi:S-adenosylmethionine decarboxylase proenzyme